MTPATFQRLTIHVTPHMRSVLFGRLPTRVQRSFWRHVAETRTADPEVQRMRQTGREAGLTHISAILEPYDTYLRSDRWKLVRDHALEYFGDHCCLCNSTANLNVHHRTYERRGSEQLRDLIVLCRDCHARYHGKET